MTLPIQKFREILFLILFSSDHMDETLDELESLIMQQLSITRKAFREGLLKVQDLRNHLNDIDALVEKHTKDYAIERIGSVEKNALRLALYEMLYEKLPPKVAMSEAVRLTRKFSTPQGSQFVNAVLDNYFKELDTPPV